jgi:hypothetical protein
VDLVWWTCRFLVVALTASSRGYAIMIREGK